MADNPHPTPIKLMDRRIMDHDSGVQYTPFVTAEGRVGYECTEVATGKFEFIYLNPSDGSDDGVANVFLYMGDRNDPDEDTPHHHYVVLERRQHD